MKSSSFQRVMQWKASESKGTRRATGRSPSHESDFWWLAAKQKPSRQSSGSSSRTEEEQEEAPIVASV